MYTSPRSIDFKISIDITDLNAAPGCMGIYIPSINISYGNTASGCINFNISPDISNLSAPAPAFRVSAKAIRPASFPFTARNITDRYTTTAGIQFDISIDIGNLYRTASG